MASSDQYFFITISLDVAPCVTTTSVVVNRHLIEGEWIVHRPKSRLSFVSAILATSSIAPPLTVQTETIGRIAECSGALEMMLSVPDILDVQVDEEQRIAIVREFPDWEQDFYDNEIFIVDDSGEQQLTDSPDGGSWHPRWQPDGDALAFLQYSPNSGTQLMLQPELDQPPLRLTAIQGGVRSFEWAPDGRSIALLLTERPTNDARTDRYGAFRLASKPSRARHLWLLDLDPSIPAEPVNRSDSAFITRLTDGDFTVGSFFHSGGYAFTPDGREVVFDHSDSNSPDDVDTNDISAVTVATGAMRPIVQQPGIDARPFVAPNGTAIAFETSDGSYRYYGRDHLAVTSLKGGNIDVITRDFHESADLVGWDERGISFLASDRMREALYRYDVRSKRIEHLETGTLNVSHAATSLNGETIITAVGVERGTELYKVAGDRAVERLTDTTAGYFVADKPLISIVRSRAADGIASEGVLYLPASANPSRDAPRPVLTIIHGGPKRTSRPTLVHDYVYPVHYWLSRGAAVFMPNYRGSAGYGDVYRAGNVRHLGDGPASDILAALDQLVEEGIADPERLGVMGWSHGGYLTAYLVSQTDLFSAASVGAGISDWRTYYIESDDPNGATQYLQATPWEDPQIYTATSAMKNIMQARTPTLIQHGDRDRRVPLSNAMELFRGLQDAGAPTELAIYEGLNHYFSKPTARLAAAEHNRRWFDHFLFEGTELDLSFRHEKHSHAESCAR
ncbi:MAG: S9 family peptidase [Pseudomonadota bacterium]